MFHLPRYQDLTLDQEDVHNLPVEGNYLIVGPPGTGKTVLAIMRADSLRKMAERSKSDPRRIVFLVYNTVLLQYLQQEIRQSNLAAVAHTFHSYIYRWFKGAYRQNPPDLPGQRYEFDWDKMSKIVVSSEQAAQPIRHLIIDEGQDFPPSFYDFVSLIAENVTVFADDNQTIRNRRLSSTVNEIRDRLGLAPEENYTLRTNFRNNRPIAEFASAFYAGSEAGIPDLPERHGPKPQIVRLPSLAEQAAAILAYEQDNPDVSIGVITYQDWLWYEMRSRLQGKTRQSLQAYKNGESLPPIIFNRPGIVLLNYQSVKGLDFDAVFMPEVNRSFIQDPRNDLHKMAMFVQTSRSCNELKMLHSGQSLPPIFREVPSHLFETIPAVAAT